MKSEEFIKLQIEVLENKPIGDMVWNEKTITTIQRDMVINTLKWVLRK